MMPLRQLTLTIAIAMSWRLLLSPLRFSCYADYLRIRRYVAAPLIDIFAVFMMFTFSMIRYMLPRDACCVMIARALCCRATLLPLFLMPFRCRHADTLLRHFRLCHAPFRCLRLICHIADHRCFALPLPPRNMMRRRFALPSYFTARDAARWRYAAALLIHARY